MPDTVSGRHRIEIDRIKRVAKAMISPVRGDLSIHLFIYFYNATYFMKP